MGAIMCLRKMPAKCSECIFASKDATFCDLRGSELIAGKKRTNRMPLCILENEGEFFTRKKEQIKKFLKNETEDKSIDILQEIRAEIEASMESIVGKYNGDTPERQRPSVKIERNEGRKQCLEIIERKMREVKDGRN